MSDKQWDKAGIGTKSVWGGEEARRAFQATQIPIMNSVAYAYEDMDEWYEVSLGNKPGYIYSRTTNPTVEAFEEKVCILESAEAAVSFTCGMAAISSTLYTFLRPGDRVVSQNDTYGGANKMFTEFLPKMGITATLCETGNHEQIEAEIDKGCRLLYLESPTNPTIKITDIKRLAEYAKQRGVLVAIDNTFATPINQNPLELGVDLVIHSATKFMGGHADALGGVVCGSKELVKELFHFREIHGAVMSPWDAYMIIRGMKTLKLRIDQQSKNALALAEYLQSHPKVKDVFYPGLPTHKNHEIAKAQMRGYGAMLSFALKGGLKDACNLLPHLVYANKAANLGPVETIYGLPRTTSHVEVTEQERAALGIPEGLVRVSVGIEDTEDLIWDISQALDRLAE